MTSPAVSVSLDAVIIAVTGDVPRILIVGDDTGSEAIPTGRLDSASDTTLERGVRRLLSEQTGLEVGYVEQLYTFGDRARRREDAEARAISVAYLALIRESQPMEGSRWIDAYELFPWEDHRKGRPALIDDRLLPGLDKWVETDKERRDRVDILFNEPWDGIRVVERYELLYEADLVTESAIDRDGRSRPDDSGTPLRFDHRRIAATALGRIRGKLTYRPVVFELLPERFTLLELQRTVEALAGIRLHKQNFRRLVERSGLVEGTGERAVSTSGRPPEVFRYRPEVQLERPRPGIGHPYR